MQGLVGWLGAATSDGASAVDRMLGAVNRSGPVSPKMIVGPSLGVAVIGEAASVYEEGGAVAAVIGRPVFVDAGPVGVPPAAFLMQLWRARGPGMLEQVHGTFALALLDKEAQTAFLAIDRIGSQSLALAARGDGIVFSDRPGAVASHPEVSRSLDPQALFNYFYFREVPAPGSAYQGVAKLLPGEQALWQRGRVERSFYWWLHYRDEPRWDFDAQSA